LGSDDQVRLGQYDGCDWQVGSLIHELQVDKKIEEDADGTMDRWVDGERVDDGLPLLSRRVGTLLSLLFSPSPACLFIESITTLP
jgi:hypothetical protein